MWVSAGLGVCIEEAPGSPALVPSAATMSRLSNDSPFRMRGCFVPEARRVDPHARRTGQEAMTAPNELGYGRS
jgi:hypothetical protein